ncbi:MAG: helix-turn-helix transcriptional regulator [Clostridiales bacterium]|uniref:helix-turn-helix domain-containing protein n=1 Tax=Terrisporobacter sp. TaxID=1965305 RepID=UPI002A553BE4|nr:helix-turn-helix transcriptional regulator [Terrisporobacter sp.]MDD7753813.1 helix-turn-helix transcriptional regulator [Clostridiales bacterium]MDY4135046.1 helix-turn-helix transcriptional regulator [Terrisporobacter sp.]
MKIEIILRKIRKEKNMSLDELAKLTGISKAHLSYIERNEKEPTISILCMIAKALNVSILDLFECHN